MKFILLFIGCIVFAAIIFFFSKRKYSDSTVSIEMHYGPFIIVAEAITGKTLNINYGIVSQTHVKYSVFHEGKAIAFPAALQTNTGLPFLWKVYVLVDAPTPTLLAGSQSLYLIYLQNGNPVVEPLIEQNSDFASLQFLDSNSGQPGIESEVFMANDSVNMDKLDSLVGGRLLLVSRHLVLDVTNLKKWKFNVNNNSLDNYSFPEPKPALALSPDQKNIVFNGSFQSWNTEDKDLPESKHAMIVYHFEKDTAYSIKYDDTETRLKDVFEINQEWFRTCFEWEINKLGEDRLRLKTLAKPLNWLGKYTAEDNYYILYPVKATMFPIFMDFVLQKMKWTKANVVKDQTGEYIGRTITLSNGDTELDLIFKEDEMQISFSKNLYTKEDPKYKLLIKEIAEAFDAELALGNYQEHFGRIN